MLKTIPLSNVDAAWLGMEDPTNLMMVSGVMTFDTPIDFQRLRQLLEARWLKFDRFRMRVVQPQGLLTHAPYWEEDPTFDMRSHLIRIGLPAPGGKPALEELASRLLSAPLDFSKPLWQFHLVEDYEGGSALIARFHHCIADGMALMFVLLSITDYTADAPLPEPPEKPKRKKRSLFGGPMVAVMKRTAETVKLTRRVTRRMVKETREIAERPSHALDLALFGVNGAMAAARLGLRPPDPKTIFSGGLGVRKRGVWTDPISLADVKTIKNATGTTVNDVLVTAMTGSLRRYLVDRGESVEGLNFRAAVPVNLRKPEEMNTLGNKFGLVFLSLPIGIENNVERLQEVNKRMAKLKDSPEALAALGILHTLGMSPRRVQSEMVNMIAAKATAVMTNVPGPPIPLYFAGSRIKNIMFWVPQAGRVSLGISIISYAGQVFMGVVTDVGIVPDPERIVEGFHEEFKKLLQMARIAEKITQAANIQPSPPAVEEIDTAVLAAVDEEE